MKGCGRDRRGKGGRIGLKLRGLLALGEMRASQAALVVVEEVVDEVRRKRDHVGEKQARRQGAHCYEPPSAAEFSEHVTYRALFYHVSRQGGVPLPRAEHHAVGSLAHLDGLHLGVGLDVDNGDEIRVAIGHEDRGAFPSQ